MMSRFCVTMVVISYCALAVLKIVGYDFSRIDSESILISLRSLQLIDGRCI